MGQQAAAFGTWRNQNKPTFQDSDETMGQQTRQRNASHPTMEPDHVKKSKSRFATDRKIPSENERKLSDFARYGMAVKNLEEEIGFKLFERLPRGVKITAAGEFLLKEARRILQEVNDATASAKRIASGQAGTLRIGFVESISWHGIIPDSLTDFRKNQPDVELHLKALSSLEQMAAIQSGSLDAGYAIPMANPDHG